MSDAPPVAESLFDDAPRQSDYGFNSDGSVFNDLGKAAEKASGNIPVHKQRLAGEKYYKEALPKVGRLFDGEDTMDELFAVVDESMTLAVNIIEAAELASIVTGATTPAEAGMNLLTTLIQTAVSVGLSFLVEYIQPLKDLFGLLTGNPGRLRTSKSMWEALAEKVQPIGTNLVERAGELGEVWQDGAAGAAGYRLCEGNDVIQVVAAFSRGIGQALEFCASTFEKVQDYMVNRASDLVGIVISCIPKLLASPVTASKVILDLLPVIMRVYIEFLQIMLHMTRAFGTLVGLMNATADAAERMNPYIEAMSGTG